MNPAFSLVKQVRIRRVGGAPVPQLVPGDLPLCLGCGGAVSGDKISIRCGAARRMNPRATPTKPAYAGWLVPWRSLMIILFVHLYRSTPDGELWAWRSYQVWIDLRCACCFECGVRSAE